MINKPKHGEIREEAINIKNDKKRAFKREKYCVKHGWIDLFLFGDINWFRQHSDCDKQIETGAVFSTQVRRRAA